jgi:hypothetical protein
MDRVLRKHLILYPFFLIVFQLHFDLVMFEENRVFDSHAYVKNCPSQVQN